MISKIKKNYKVLIIGIGLGILISGIGVYATTKLSSSEVLYDNSKSGGSSSNVQGTLEELYQKTKDYKPCSSAVWEANNKYFVEGYTYNESSCVTGDEKTCLRTDCYISSDKVCPPGTIIDYVVSGNSNKVRFHVMYDDGETMTMQSQNTIKNAVWNSTRDNTKGPLIILEALENATNSWTHVNTQTYTMGTTNFNYTGCSRYDSCTKNTYTLSSRTAKAKMITLQQATKFGCTASSNSCPKWLTPSITGYWTATANSTGTTSAWYITRLGYLSGDYTDVARDVRAVVVVSK